MELSPAVDLQPSSDGQSKNALMSYLSLAVYERIQQAFPRPSHRRTATSMGSSSILTSSTTAARPVAWAEDASPSCYRWAPIWSALGKGKGRAGELLPIDRLSTESEAVCDEFGWHFVARYPLRVDGDLEQDLRGLVRFPQTEQSAVPHLREMIHPLPKRGRTDDGAEGALSAYLIFPHGTQVLQPAFDKLLLDGRQADVQPRRLNVRHATADDLRVLLGLYEGQTATLPSEANHGTSFALAADPHAHSWHDHTFTGPAFFTSQNAAAAAAARAEAGSASVETEWWKPAFQFARALAWVRYLSLLPTWPTPAGRPEAAGWRSVIGSLPDTLAFNARPSALRPTRVHISGLPPRYKTSLLTKHFRARPDYGAWVHLIRRAPTVRTMAVLKDARDATGLAAFRRFFRGERSGVDGRERVKTWIGQSLVGASIERLPFVRRRGPLSTLYR